MNDTGQTLCYDGTALVVCTDAVNGVAGTYPRQDATWVTGFSFTALDASGNAIAPTGSHECVRDNITGLVWSTEDLGDTYNNAVAAAGSYSRCGYTSGWRVPTASELLSIVYTGKSFPAIDTTYFYTVGSWSYWTAAANLYPSSPGTNMVVDFAYGVANSAMPVASPAKILYVWSATPPALSTYTDNGDGTVTDNVTGLIWDRCSLGQSGATCTGTATTMDWQAALQAVVTANNNNYLGYNNWRLPNRNELDSIVNWGVSNQATNIVTFPNTQSGLYWSSTPVNMFSAFVSDFQYAQSMPRAYATAASVRLVRNLPMAPVPLGGSWLTALFSIGILLTGTAYMLRRSNDHSD